MGTEFLVRVMVEDRRGYGLNPSDVFGVFAAYLDVTWDSRLAEAVGEIEYSSDYAQIPEGEIQPGLIDEIGAVATSGVGLTQERFEVASVRFRARQSGEVTFRGNPADVMPAHDVLLFGESKPTLSRDIEFVDSVPVTISDTTEAPDLVQFAKDLAMPAQSSTEPVGLHMQRNKRSCSTMVRDSSPSWR